MTNSATTFDPCNITWDQFVELHRSGQFTKRELDVLQLRDVVRGSKSVSSFATAAFDLTFQCDSQNLEKMRKGFPEFVEAVEGYLDGRIHRRTEKFFKDKESG